MISLKDLDLSCVSADKLTHEILWTIRRWRPGQRQYKFGYEARYRNAHHYTDATPGVRLAFSLVVRKLMIPVLQYPHSAYLEEETPRPFREIDVKLDKVCNDNTAVEALVVGKGPLRRCALVCIEPKAEERGLFYYLPFH